MAKCRNNLNKNNILSLPADYFGWRSRRKGGQAFYYNLFMGEKPIKRISISILNANRFTIFVPISGYDFKCVVIKYYPKQDCAFLRFFLCVFAVK